MVIETYLLQLAALAILFATPPDTSQLLIIADSARYRPLWRGAATRCSAVQGTAQATLTKFARSREGADDRALRAPWAALGQGRCRSNIRQPRSRHGHAAGHFRRHVMYAKASPRGRSRSGRACR